MTDAVKSKHFSDPVDLNTIEYDCWHMLRAAVHDRSCGWRLPVLATCSNGEVRQRTVVLRKVERSARRILVHTDLRSPKLKSINNNPDVSWLFYDAVCQVQLQLTGLATVHTDDKIAEQLWQHETESSLRGYLAPYVPGTVRSVPESNLPDDMRQRIPQRDQLSAARENFAVISGAVKIADWLLLRPDGNLRARFTYEDGSVSSGNWLAP
ncbi:MAG: hypothetical protein GY826_22405 [Fuerstiella sp.]|nr:hypothetical protein [Fuerstiella sp.]